MRTLEQEAQWASQGALSMLRYGDGAGAECGRALTDLSARGPVAILHDGVPKPAAHGDLLEVVTTSVEEAGYDHFPVIAPDPGHGVVLDEPTVASVQSDVASAGAVVTVGSGTITDLGKAVTPEGTVLVAVQSAPSVNGFSDPLSVLIRSGAKSTVPTRWSDALLIDEGALLRSPAHLVGAGVGDAIAATSAVADWVLAGDLGAGEAAEVDEVADVRTAVDALAAGPDAPGAMPALVDALTRGGLVLGHLGSTAALSGCEHLLSHILDMTALAAGTDHDLHGRQVGVATVLATALWDVALAEGLLRVEPAARYPEDLAEQVRAVWLRADPSGALGATCERNVLRKQQRWAQAPGIRIDEDRAREVAALTAAPEVVVATLKAWGAPCRLGDLDPAVDGETGRWALHALPFMRDRLTLADVLVMNGTWTPDLIERVIARAEEAGGGL